MYACDLHFKYHSSTSAEISLVNVTQLFNRLVWLVIGIKTVYNFKYIIVDLSHTHAQVKQEPTEKTYYFFHFTFNYYIATTFVPLELKYIVLYGNAECAYYIFFYNFLIAIHNVLRGKMSKVVKKALSLWQKISLLFDVLIKLYNTCDYTYPETIPYLISYKWTKMLSKNQS